MRFHPVLAIGICLNALQLTLKHLGVYQRLPIPEKAQDFVAGFLTGMTIVFLLIGLVLSVRPEVMDRIREWKLNLFGGN